MLIVESQVRDFMLESNVAPLLASQVAHTLAGVNVDGVADVDGHIQFDGAVKAEKWPHLMAQLKQVPSEMIQIDDMPTSSGQSIEFSIRVSQSPLSEEAARQSFAGLSQAYSEDIDDLPEDDDMTIVDEVDQELNP